MPEINDDEPDDLEPPGKPDAGTELDDTDPEGVNDTTSDNWDADGEFDSDEGESDVAEVDDDSIDQSQQWPDTPEEMDQRLGFEGRRIPDGPDTPGRNKVEWKPSSDVNIVYEQHPYHTNAPDWHRGPHWHLDDPGAHHQRRLRGDPL